MVEVLMDFRFVLVATTASTKEFDTNSIVINNPVKDQLTIEGLNQSIKQISVYDLLGKQVMISNFSDNETSINLNVSSLNSGLYIVKLEGGKRCELYQKNNKRVITKIYT